MNSGDGIILPSNGPWGGKPGDDDHGAWRPQGKPGTPPPDLDGMLRDAQERIRRSFGGGPPGLPAQGKGIGVVAVVLLLVWLATGFYRIQPSEDAVVLTFGKLTATKTEPGLGYALPWPVQEVRKVDVSLDRRISLGYRGDVPPRSMANNLSADVSGDSLMLTGDENIINIDYVVLWRASDAAKYLFNIRDPDNTINKVAESAMREIIGRTPIQKALTEGRGDIEARAKELMQKVLDDYQSGIVVNNVQLQKVDPPAPVVDAFDDVQRARSDRERLKNEAETYSNDIVPRARGDAQKKVQDAEAYKQAVTSKAEGEAKRFLSVHAAYKVSKDVTEKRIYLETMQGVLQNSRKIIVGDDKGTGVVPYLPLEQLAPAKK